ncbi:hypothetical protein [Phocaeicola coprophilus]|uniref:hypothetical protein n=1 Tax=Phocaeicola coprophilus TaxID=387090 RepID=UPI0039925B24
MGVINKTTETINTLLDKVEGLPEEGLTGKTPVFEVGYVTTVSAGSPANVNIRENGVDEDGNPIYLIDFDIPKGKDGTTTDSEGNPVTLDWDSVLNKPDWLDSKTKPSYTAEEVGALPNNTSFKTINGESILGEGNIDIQGGTSGSGVGQNYTGYKNAEIFNDYENNIAAGAHAHAEGRETNATGPRAHAEGYQTKVFAADSHAEGRETWCLGNQGHVEGMYGIVFGSLSHLEGMAFQQESPEESRPKLLNDEETIRSFLTSDYFVTQSTDAGYYIIADYESLQNDYCLHASFGERNHVEGINNLCFSNTSHVEGMYNVCGKKITSHGASRIHDCVHMEGRNNYVDNETNISDSSHIGGAYCAIYGARFSFAHGEYLTTYNDHEVAFGKYNLSSINGKNVLFSYGIGTSELTRKNAFSVYEDGGVEIPQLKSVKIEQLEKTMSSLEILVTQIQSNILLEIKNLKEEINAIYDYIINNPSTPTDKKAYVIGINLIFKASENISVVDDTLNITDSEIKVENDTLII